MYTCICMYTLAKTHRMPYLYSFYTTEPIISSSFAKHDLKIRHPVCLRHPIVLVYRLVCVGMRLCNVCLCVCWWV